MNRHTAHTPFWTRAIFLVLLLAIPAMASAFDQVGIYFDQSYQNYAITVAEPNTIVTGYLVLNEPSASSGVAGWELCVGVDGPATFLSWELEGQTINIETEPCFMVGIGDGPLPATQQVLLATFTMLVQEPLPIALSVSPVYHESIPDQMAYLTGDDPGEILPLGSVSGEPELAWINANIPVALVEPSNLFFGEIPVGHSVDRFVGVSNIGGGTLIVNVEMQGPAGGISLPSIYGSFAIHGGETLNIPVRFLPTDIQLYTRTLTFNNPIVPNVTVNGSGREPILAWNVAPELTFPQTNVGEARFRELIVYNTGEMAFTIEPQVASGCASFSIDNPTPHTLEPGEEFPIIVGFTPDVDGPISCELNLGSVVDPVTLTGTGYLPVMSYDISPSLVVFPDIAVGMSTVRNILLTNTGEGVLNLHAGLAEPSDEFALVYGDGPRAVDPGQRAVFTVQFSPTAIAPFTAEMTFGNPLVANVPLSGSGVAENMSCITTPEVLDFGVMTQGGVYSKYITVRNDGNVDLELAPEAICSGTTTFLPSSFTLPPGNSQNFTVSRLAQTLGPWECAINMGPDACSEVICSGVVQEGISNGENLVGLFFDSEFTQSDAFIGVPGVLDAHLVLMNPTDLSGLSGWECQLQISGTSILIGATLMGQSVNVGVSPEFIVGLGEPLPWAPNIHLATFLFFVLDPGSETALFLMPTNTPSIPDQMVWLSADYNNMLPMTPHTGSPLVSYINGSGVVAVQAPAPEVVMQGNMVELTWDVADNTTNGYLVYRRGETGSPELLFEQPRTAEGGHFVYHDNPMGFDNGSTLHYSYAVIQDGVEVTRSPETEIILNGVPMVSTRLLPNVPNPFNPMTEVKFEMEKAGQVRVAVYDVSGRKVKTLVNESLSSGPHSRLWQGRDSSGRQVPSGTYYLRMETGGHVDHHKMMLLK